MPNLPLNPEPFMVNGIPVVSTRDIADHFNKRHDDILKKIKTLDVPEDFRLRNFAESSYINGQNKEQPAYNLTRDGFTILVMGFTGKKAMAWKVKYIEAFNMMEKELTRSQKAIPKNDQKTLTASLPSDRRPLREAVDRWVRTKFAGFQITNNHFRASWRELNEFMEVDSVKDIPRENLRYALEYVEEQIEIWGGKTTAALPAVKDEKPKGDAVTKVLAESDDLTLDVCLQGAKLALLRRLYNADSEERKVLFPAYDAVLDAEKFVLEREVNHAR